MRTSGCLCGGVAFLGLSLTTISLADTDSDYRSAQTYIERQHISKRLSASVLNAHNTLPGAPLHPVQEAYYHHPESISMDATSHISTTHTIGNVLKNDALMRSKMMVNEHSPEIQFSKNVQDHAEAISNGTYKDCKKTVFTDFSDVKKTCSTSLPFKFDCVKTLVVHINMKSVTKSSNIHLSNYRPMDGSSHSDVRLPVEKGMVTGLSIQVRDNRYVWPCFRSYALYLNGVNIGSYYRQCENNVRVLVFNARGVSIPFHQHTVTLALVGGKFHGEVSGSLSFSYQVQEKTPMKTWVSSCAVTPATCYMSQTQCLEPGGTKTWEGVSVTAACWKEKERYQCGASLSAACQALAVKGCTQVATRCSQTEAGVCQQYDETWSCPDKKTRGSGIQCGERFYCMDGLCQVTQHEKNTAFGKSVTELDAVASVGEEVKKTNTNSNNDPNAIRIFAGQAAHCRDVVLGALNCCADRGWAKGIVVNCNREETVLGHAKEQGGRVISIGRYCSKHVLGICTEHKRGYCIFPSRIAYDIQKYGRYIQLGRGFGDGKTPDCSGLSPGDIEKINFDQIDFSNVINTVSGHVTLPDNNQSKNNIKKHIQDAVARK